MQIKLNKTIGATLDLLTLLTLVQIEDLEEKFVEAFRLNMSLNSSEKVKLLKQYIDTDSKALKLLFDEKSGYHFLEWHIKSVWEINHVNELPNYFRTLKDDEIKSSLINYLSYDDNSQLINDDIFAFVSGLNLSNEMKWSMMAFIRKPKDYLDEIADIIDAVLPMFNTILEKDSKKMELSYSAFERDIQNVSDTIIEELNPLFKISEYKEIKLSFSIFDQTVAVFTDIKDISYLTLGKDYRKILMHMRGDNIDKSLKVLNALSDPMKFSILKCMKNKAVYGGEICKLTGLSKASLSYHINYLNELNLITLSKKGNRIYYSLSRPDIFSALEHTKIFFED